ncbi:MAG: hypothetical protein EON54_00915 [Alcaligenaceae bacterium]|jgi:hypothetical protein|nr:MAG: hypothetical protein EON54_00915 [Alcaligenaceae bacterium]
MTEKAQAKRELELIAALVELQASAARALDAFALDHAHEMNQPAMQHVLSNIKSHLKNSLEDLYEDESRRREDLIDLERSEAAALQRQRDLEIKTSAARRREST